MATKKKGSTEVATVSENTVQEYSGYAEDAGAGFEHANQSSYSIPRLYMLQALSPQVGKRNPEYIEGAEAGMIYNSVTKQVVKSLDAISVLFRQTWIEWVPRIRGGGYVAEHFTKDKLWISQAKGPFLTADGNEVNDTRSFFLVLRSGDVAVLSMTASQIRRAMDWMTVMSNKRGKSADGRTFPLPMFASIYTLEGDFQSNDKGDWYGWKITDTGKLIPQDSELYAKCKSLRDMVNSGLATAVNPDAEGRASMDAEDVTV